MAVEDAIRTSRDCDLAAEQGNEQATRLSRDLRRQLAERLARLRWPDPLQGQDVAGSQALADQPKPLRGSARAAWPLRSLRVRRRTPMRLH